MTMDHIGASSILSDSLINEIFRSLGRLCAPVFLFLVVESLRHTSSKFKYTLRLYLAGALIHLLNIFTALNFNLSITGNIFQTFFYVSFYICLIDTMSKNSKNINFLLFLLTLIPFLFVPIEMFLIGNHSGWFYITKAFIPSPFSVEYSFLFVLLGVSWYFCKNKYLICAILIGFSIISYLIPITFFFTQTLATSVFHPAYFTAFHLFAQNQWLMILAIPFILLYNGQKGGSLKYFFYLYYPLHQYLLQIIKTL